SGCRVQPTAARFSRPFGSVSATGSMSSRSFVVMPRPTTSPPRVPPESSQSAPRCASASRVRPVRWVHAMSEKTEATLDTVWTFIDEPLNALLFLLIGVAVFAIDYGRTDYQLAALMLVPAVLLARLVSVAVPLTVLRTRAAI